jgi:queuine tRNA-ribosyltransferase
MNDRFGFTILKKAKQGLARVGLITTPHGTIETPAFIVVGTKATVKSLTMEQVKTIGAQAVLSNTYHFYLAPGDEIVRDAGGLGTFMDWDGPTFTDSGGFQVFSLGVAYGKGIGKVAKEEEHAEDTDTEHDQLAKVDDEGVTFKSHRDGSSHRFTPERSIQIQHNIGADIIVAFDECTSPHEPHEKQKISLDRTHAWAIRSLAEHKRLLSESVTKTVGTIPAALYGVVQGGKYQDLREEAARTIGAMDFDGFGIGGSFGKDDIGTAVTWVNSILPEDKPRHLLGIGEPIDFFYGIEAGVDTFDCVSPTRLGRNGSLYTKDGKLNINNAKFVRDLTPVESDCPCYTCTHYTRAYLAHLFREGEMLGAALGSIHNLHFAVNLVHDIRQSILDDRYDAFKESVLSRFYKE